jgi:cyclophilin family peptidyl-prolyl cis-trans isomerase
MSVLLETSAGDIVIDLLVDYAPKECEKYVNLLVNDRVLCEPPQLTAHCTFVNIAS